MHRLLERQLRKTLGRTAGFPLDLQALLDAVDIAYRQGDEDRTMLERSMNLSSRELMERNAELAAAAERQAQHSRLIELSRQRGMADVATSVLHNVGNVLTNVNAALDMALRRLRGSRLPGLTKLAEMVSEHRGELPTFFAAGGKGTEIPDYLITLAEHLSDEQRELREELASLGENLEHIKRIVATQQRYAKVSGVAEVVPISDLVEDVLRLNKLSGDGGGVDIVREFEPLPPVATDKHHVMQILVNLIGNARHAMRESQRRCQLTVRIRPSETNPRNFVIQVADTGVGIPRENLTRIFNYGFTTRPDGHGFGLHGSALAAHAMGGSLTVHSDGVGAGATFTLELPRSAIPDPASAATSVSDTKAA